MKLITFSLLISILVLTLNCASNKNSSPVRNKTADEKTADGHLIISAEIVKKNFVNKVGKISEREEFYVRRSVQDYFIKFCESGITEEEFDALYAKKSGLIKSFKMEVEIRDGLWDSCDNDEMVQSRSGEYMVIHKILE